ncbi:chemotaxis protein CheE [Brevundimonas sp.]
MTEAKIFKHRSSLAKKMAVPGGKAIDDALQAAEAALDTHRDAAMETLQATLTRLDGSCAERDQGQVYLQAAAMLDMAGFFETGPLHTAVFSLCEISDPAGDHVWDLPSVQVHLSAIRMILSDDCRVTESSQILLEGLASVRRRSAEKSAT